jgi:hypothetical protein
VPDRDQRHHQNRLRTGVGEVDPQGIRRLPVSEVGVPGGVVEQQRGQEQRHPHQIA